MLPFPLNIILGVALVAFFFWRAKKRWDGASAYVDARAEKARKFKEQLPKFKEDPRYKKVKEYIDAKYKTSFDEPLDEETYKIDAVYFQVQKGYQMHIETLDAENPDQLVFLLRSKKERRSVCLDIVSQEITESPVGNFIYDSMLRSIDDITQ